MPRVLWAGGWGHPPKFPGATSSLPALEEHRGLRLSVSSVLRWMIPNENIITQVEGEPRPSLIVLLMGWEKGGAGSGVRRTRTRVLGPRI